VKFVWNQQWKVVKGNLVMACGRKRGSLYMVGLPSEGVTVPVQKINKVMITKSLVGRRGLSLQERNSKQQVRLRMNEHGKAQVDKSEGENGSYFS